jgi:hypothetical protein
MFQKRALCWLKTNQESGLVATDLGTVVVLNDSDFGDFGGN